MSRCKTSATPSLTPVTALLVRETGGNVNESRPPPRRWSVDGCLVCGSFSGAVIDTTTARSVAQTVVPA